MTNKELTTIWEMLPENVQLDIDMTLYDQFNATISHLNDYGAWSAVKEVEKAELSRKKELVWEYIYEQLNNKKSN